MSTQISIPAPCHENWNNMFPNETGRHCSSCCKTVVDFTHWETEDINFYLQQRNENVCGRFKNSQLADSKQSSMKKLMRNVIGSKLPFLRKIAAVVMLCFVSMQTDAQKTVGKISRPIPAQQTILTGDVVLVSDTTVSQPVIKDVNEPRHEIMGMVAPPRKPIKKRK